MENGKDPKNIVDASLMRNNDVVSMSDCTGLIGNLPKDADEAKAYKEIYPVPNTVGLTEFKKELDKG